MFWPWFIKQRLLRLTPRKSPCYWPFVKRIHCWPMNSPHKWPIMRETFLFDDVIMRHENATESNYSVDIVISYTTHLSLKMSINIELAKSGAHGWLNGCFVSNWKIPCYKVIHLWDWSNLSIHNSNIFITHISKAIVIRQRQSGDIHSFVKSTDWFYLKPTQQNTLVFSGKCERTTCGHWWNKCATIHTVAEN